jgi:hypothetical protein
LDLGRLVGGYKNKWGLKLKLEARNGTNKSLIEVSSISPADMRQYAMTFDLF